MESFIVAFVVTNIVLVQSCVVVRICRMDKKVCAEYRMYRRHWRLLHLSEEVAVYIYNEPQMHFF